MVDFVKQHKALTTAVCVASPPRSDRGPTTEPITPPTHLGKLIQKEVDVPRVDDTPEKSRGDDHPEEVAPREKVHRGYHLAGIFVGQRRTTGTCGGRGKQRACLNVILRVIRQLIQGAHQNF